MASSVEPERESREKCAPPWHVGPVRILKHWGKSGQYRSRVCDHCGLQWRERMLRFGRRGQAYWRRAILSLDDLDPPAG
jgi:hypothetical protein